MKVEGRPRWALRVYATLCCGIIAISLFAAQQSNDKQPASSVEVVEIGGEPWLLYKMDTTSHLIRFKAITHVLLREDQPGRHTVYMGGSALYNELPLQSVRTALDAYFIQKEADHDKAASGNP